MIILFGFILLFIWNNVILFAILNCLAGFFIGWITPANDTFESNLVDQTNRGDALGIYNSLGLSVGIIGPIIVGTMGDAFFLSPYLLLMLLAMIGTFLAFTNLNSDKTPKKESFATPEKDIN